MFKILLFVLAGAFQVAFEVALSALFDSPIGISSIVSGTLGAVLGSRAQKKAAEANIQAARETNEMNYRMFQEGRGSTGSAILPLYFQDMERQIGDDAVNDYRSIRRLTGSPQSQVEKARATLGAYQPMIDAATGSLMDVYNGNLTETRQGYLKPVTEARTALARTQKEGVLQGLRERINALNAQSAAKGYSGSGSFAQNRLLDATIKSRQAAAATDSIAALENAQDVRNVNDQGANMRLQYMQMPFQLGQQALNYSDLPMQQVRRNSQAATAPLDFFRMNPGAFRADQLPMQGADTTWPAIMNSIGNANSQGAALAMMLLGGKGGGGAGAGAGVQGGWGGGGGWAAGMA